MFESPTKHYQEGSLTGLLPGIQHQSQDLEEFFYPSTALLGWKIVNAFGLRDLVMWDKVPRHLITHLASSFGFELLDEPYLSERERREFLEFRNQMMPK